MSVPFSLSLKKTAEALYIRHGLSNAIMTQLEENKQKTKEAVKEEVSTLKEDLSDQTENLTNSVKGKFGKQAKEAIKTESKKVDNF